MRFIVRGESARYLRTDCACRAGCNAPWRRDSSEFLQHRSPHTALCYLAENDGKMAQEAVDNLQLA
jgi:hypothetical protein